MKGVIFNAMLVAGILVSSSASATTGYFSEGYGIKANGMGGVGIAFPQDALAAATNPAGMVMVGNRIDFGLNLFRPARSAQIVGAGTPGPGVPSNGNYDGNGKSNFLIPEFGYNRMISRKTSLGVSVYGNGGMNSDYAVNPFGGGLGGQGNGGVNLMQLFVAPTWSRKIGANNAIGISLNLAYQRFSAQGIQGFANYSTSPQNVSNNGTDTATGYGFHIGWIGEVYPGVTLGATYQSRTRMSKFAKYAGFFAEQGALDIPASFGAGIAVKVTADTILAADVDSIQYGSIKTIANPLAPGVPFNLGADNGAGFGWKNMMVYKFGLSHDTGKGIKLRAGYSHNSQQIPNDQTFFNIMSPATVQDHVALGATWTLADKSEISVAYMHAFKNTIIGANSIPQGGNANISLSEDSLGIAYGW